MNAIRRCLVGGVGLAAAVAVSLLLVAPAAAANRADPVTPEAAAAQMCGAAQAALGPMFGTLVGTTAQCETKALAILKDAMAKCTTAADNATCVNAAVQAGVMTLASGGGGAAAAINEQAVSQACSQLQGRMGAARFAKEYGSVAGCKTKLGPEIEKIVGAAQTACSGNADPSGCIATQTAAAEATMVARLGGGPSGASLAGDIASEVCARLQVELGDRFAKKYGSTAACETQIAAKATPLANAASAACKGQADQEACITAEINAKTDELSQTLGAGPTLTDITDEIAENACARLKTELGARFATRFKSDAGCRTQIAQASESFASVALGTCLKATDKASCIQAQVTAGTATLQDALGSGPTPAELAAEIAEQACPQIMADNPDGFSRTYGGLTKCRSQLAAQIPAADLKAVIAKCTSAKDVGACTAQAAADLSAKLADQVSGPSLDDIVLDAEGQTCQRLESQMGAEFRSRFVTMGICREKIGGDVTKLAKSAWASCKAAKDKAGCTERALTDDIQKLAAAWGAGPSSTEIGSRLAAQACNSARQELGAAEFAAQLKSLETCNALIQASARASAATAINACGSTATAARSACLEKQLAAAGPAVEKELRARADVPTATVQSIATSLATQICQRARDQIGTLLDTTYGGDAKCRAWMQPIAEKQVAVSIPHCNKGRDQACMKQQIDGSITWIQKQYFPVPADPTFYEVNATIGSIACGEGRNASQAAGLVAAFDKKFASPTKDTVTNCAKWFNYAAGEPASNIVQTCTTKRPADVRRSCFAGEIEKATRALGPAIQQLVKAAAGKK